ncbi:serine hydrolase domain-containing protein [Streptomyces sp. SAI-229]|uniref:serine hydrolase domain-containing protein n=1 Tax=Streptomyces sp. SAI-229 TaxID=3377731 RepID=UPI003C7B9A46
MERTLEEAGYVGVSVEVRDGRHRVRARAGEAEPGSGRPVPCGAALRAASTTKAVVATVVLHLIAEGRLSLDDTVERRLPGVVTGNGNDGNRVTVRHLLQHTSGIHSCTSVRDLFPAGYSARGYYDNRFRHYTAAELVAGAMRWPPRFEAGTGYAYSHTDYVLAGMITERVTGRAWRHEVRDRIIRPLALTGTSLPADDPRPPSPYAHGYHTYAEDGRRVDTTLFDSTAADASGALVTTPEDVNRFFTALIGGRLLGPDEPAGMQRTRAVPDEPGRGYGPGLERTPLSCGGFYWHHGGNALGHAGENGVTADGRRAVTVSTNSFDTFGGERQDRIDEAMRNLIDRALCDGRPGPAED